MASKLQHTDISLRDLVASVTNGNFTIPKFQREFVWKNGDILSLGDSIIRGYPIASLLVMPCDGNLRVSTEALKTGGGFISEDLSKTMYLLDGQQRVTSIAKIFANFDNNNSYYFDLFEILSEEFSDDQIEIENNRKIKSDGFCRSFKRGEYKDDDPTRHNFRFISGKTILEDKFATVIRKFLKTIKNLDDTKEEYDKYENYLNALLGSVSSFGIPMTSISKDADLGLICRVFEKVNSSGIKLTTFDLINAKSFDSTKYKDGLANYITKDLLEMLENDNSLYEVFRTFLKYDNNINKFNDLSRIARILACLTFLKQDKTPALTNHAMLAKDSDFWFDSWNAEKQKIKQYLSWIAKEDIINLAPYAYYEYLGALVVNNMKILEYPVFLKYLKKKGLGLGIKTVNFSKSNIEDVMEIKTHIQGYLNASDFDKYKFIPKENDIIVTETEILKFNKGNMPYNIVIHLMKNEKNGFFNNDLADISINNDYDLFDEHHIIPKSRVVGKGNIYNTITNITLLNKNTNRNEIKNKCVYEYLSFFEKNFGREKYEYLLTQNMIPLCFSDEEDFLNQRSKLILNFINKYFNS